MIQICRHAKKKAEEEFSALASKNKVAIEKKLAQISRQIWNIQSYDDFIMDVQVFPSGLLV